MNIRIKVEVIRPPYFTCELGDGALVHEVLKDHLLARRHHAAYKPQTVPHLGPLVASTTQTMETIPLPAEVICNTAREG